MGIEVKRQSLFNNGESNSRADQPKAQVWMNVGYSQEVSTGEKDDKGKDIMETIFIALPLGLPVDTMEPININTRNQSYGQLQAARNDLLSQLQDAAAKLAPGEETSVKLEIQLRRVSDPAVVPAADETNPFVKQNLKIVG
jgi:hypothetical protein